MTYLLYYRSDDPNAAIDEYIVLTLDPPQDHTGRYQRAGYLLCEVVKIDEELYSLPLDRELIVRG